MIIETIIQVVALGGMTAFTLKAGYDYTTKPEVQKLLKPTNHSPAFSQTVQLVSALLDENEGWTSEKDEWHRHNKAGVVVFHPNKTYFSLLVRDEKGIAQNIELTESEKRELTAKLNAYKARTRNTQADRIARVLANRILEPVAPALLGGPGTSSHSTIYADQTDYEVRSPDGVTYAIMSASGGGGGQSRPSRSKPGKL